jgi:beta-lactamase regulating signal transducer with metallopeptidase domain
MENPPLASLLKASWQAAVLILLVLIVQRMFGSRLSPRWRYSLWLLVIIRLALPWTTPSNLSVFNLLNLRAGIFHTKSGVENARPMAVPVAATLSAQQATSSAASEEASRHAHSSSYAGILVIWLAGALALGILLLITQCRLSRRVALRRPLTEAAVLNVLEDCKQEMGVRVPVTLVETPEVGSPALFGFMRPRLLLPVGLARSFSPAELRYIFLHELGHIKRRDILTGWVMTGLQIVHWFNPFVWLAFHRMRGDRELACDALALSYVREGENQLYGQTIIKLLESFGRSAWAPNLAGTVENQNQITERIRMIAKYRKTNRGLALAAALFAGLGMVTLTDAEPAVAQIAKDLVGTWVLVGTPGNVGPAPAKGGRFKNLTDSHWSATQTDPKTGVVIHHLGGTYTIKGTEYVEHVEFAGETAKDHIGKDSKFNLKLEGDTLTIIGIGNPWKEVWKRSAAAPTKSDPDSLQGTWTGREARDNSSGAASLVITGSAFEFHNVDTNEWYKVTYSIYDTNPQQLVTIITQCPFPQYVGKTSYSIYKLENGELTVAGNEPGNPVVPASFDASGARKFVFKRK